MTRLCLALVCLVGCGGGAVEGGAPAGPRMPAKRVSVSWGVSQQGEMADLYLQTTDETGGQVSHELGRWKGECAPGQAPPAMNALITLNCKTGSTGTQLQVVTHGGDELIVMKLGIGEGAAADPMAREEVKRIKVPLGAKIEAGS